MVKWTSDLGCSISIHVTWVTRVTRIAQLKSAWESPSTLTFRSHPVSLTLTASHPWHWLWVTLNIDLESHHWQWQWELHSTLMVSHPWHWQWQSPLTLQLLFMCLSLVFPSLTVFVVSVFARVWCFQVYLHALFPGLFDDVKKLTSIARSTPGIVGFGCLLFHVHSALVWCS